MRVLHEKFILFLFLIVIFVTSCIAQKSDIKESSKSKTMNSEETKTTNESKYKVGQMWSYQTRPDEKTSYFIILKVDADEKLGNIIHIALRNLKMKNPNSPNEFLEGANHLPFSEKSINESAVKILKEKVELPDYEEGYGMWKEAFDAKRAGIYTTSIAKVVEAMEAGLNQ